MYSVRRAAKRSSVQTASRLGSTSRVIWRGALLAWVFPRSWLRNSLVVVPKMRSITDPKCGGFGGRLIFVDIRTERGALQNPRCQIPGHDRPPTPGEDDR